MSAFPFIVSGSFATYKGNFFVNLGDHWRKIEKYLPGDVGTMGEPLEQTALTRLQRLNDGEPWKAALTDNGNTNRTRYELTGDKFTALIRFNR